MKNLCPVVAGVNFIVFATLIVYFSTTWLNLIFTFTWLRPDDVPFYNSTLVGTLGSTYSDRYNWEWWIFLTDITYYIPPALFSMIFLDKIMNPGNGFLGAAGFLTAFITVMTWIKNGYRAYVWWYCVDFQFCRNFVPGECNQKWDCDPNYVWQIIVFYNVFQSFVCVFYVFLIGAIYLTADARHRDMEVRGLYIEKREPIIDPDGFRIKFKKLSRMIRQSAKKGVPYIFNRSNKQL